LDGGIINQKRNNMYSVSGIVKDEKGVGIPRAVVSNGAKGVFTDKDGNYQIETDVYKNKIRISKAGYVTQTIDLSKYPNDSSVNGSVTLNFDVDSSLNPNAGEQKTSYNKPEFSTAHKIIIWSLVGISVIVAGVLIYKKVKK
jgi:uncharacterized membrane protein